MKSRNKLSNIYSTPVAYNATIVIQDNSYLGFQSALDISMGTKVCKPVRTYEEVKELLTKDELREQHRLFSKLTESGDKRCESGPSSKLLFTHN